ncbi:hypothetical protein OCK74_08850 [Chitinophagaceae bacterium LB-8]|uniref:Redoxin domain-containing protein n=1 Tax=Paraflavisolibacter caeni TaxID=2982496 RepID=A0A9X2XVB7_9BACT|nr:hypothetical protein [Paraflavisolibacter caeni]MCU7549222.1 hypothetical protein [Paraflavisolibacter caeni]
MKYILSLLLLASLCSFSFLDDLYSLSLNTLEGKKVELGSFRGKKLLFVVLPLSAQDTSFRMGELEALQHKYDTSLIVIGVPAEETGFEKTKETELKALYKNMPATFILAEGMKVKKSAGAEQSPLFQWLTNKSKNHHFDQDVLGTGHKFFVDERGELYAVMGPKIALAHPVMERILSKPLGNVYPVKPYSKKTEEKASAN